MTMPTYEYACDTCGIRFERRQRITDDPLKKCPECEGPVHRVPYPVGIVFKGSGFYCTDHRRSANNLAVPKDRQDGDKGRSESKSEGASKDEGTSKGEAKPEKKD